MNRISRIFNGFRITRDGDFAAKRGVDAKQGAQDFCPPCPNQAGETDDFTSTHFEIQCVLRVSARPQTSDR